MPRLTWDQYFMKIADTIGERGTCDRGRSGAVIVLDKRIIATGYVGSPPGRPHCDEAGHLMRAVIDENGQQSMHCIRTVHAEENAILQAARYGISLKGSTIYCKMVPCYHCAMQIVSVGMERVVAKKRYHADGLSRELFNKAEIKLEVCEDKLEEYHNQ